MSFFPTTNAKSNGANFPEQNRKCGPFSGVIKDIRPIKSNSNNTVFAVIELEVQGEPGVFQDYLNFNPKKAKTAVSSNNKEEESTYVVQSGDSLYSIARKYPGVSIRDLQAANGLTGSQIHPGQILKIPEV